jgi:uncharacterized OB-fold protein
MSIEPIHPSVETLPFWEGTQNNRLMLQQCRSCGRMRHYPRDVCPHCFSDQFEWVECAGRGTVYSYTIVHRAPSPAFASQVPYVVANVRLAEGPHMMSRIAGCAPGDVRIGMAVRVQFEPAGEFKLPIFVPDDGSATSG